MTREFLQSLQAGDMPLPDGVIDAILQEHEKHRQSWQETYDQTVQDHKSALAKVRFEGAVKEAITAHHGKNHKAISALLDLEGLQKQADIATAVNQAVAQVKKENGYLFADPSPAPYAPTAGTGNSQIPYPQTLAGALREKFDNK